MKQKDRIIVERITPREQQLLQHLLVTTDIQKLAQLMSVSSKTIKNKITDVMEKCGCHSKHELVEAIKTRGLV